MENEKIKQNFTQILQLIDKQEKQMSFGQSVSLIAVSKKQPLERIQGALDFGHRVFGENYLQEAEEKWTDLKQTYSDIELHYIGHIQSKKIKPMVALFDAIHTIDRESVAEKISQELKAQKRDLKLFVQVNTGEEEQKSGVMPGHVIDFVQKCQSEFGLKIFGLMCIPPAHQPASPHFALLKKLADQLGLKELSMGMSADYLSAISLGATHIRLGTSLFGPRG